MFNPSSSSHGFSCNIMEPFSLTMYWQETALRLRSEEVEVEMEDRRAFMVIREGRSYCYGHYYPESGLLPGSLSVGQARCVAIDNCKPTDTLQPKAKNGPQRKNPVVVSNCPRRPGRFFC